MIPVKVNPFQVLIQISPYAAAVLLCFTVTLGCFPAITARVRISRIAIQTSLTFNSTIF